MCPWGILLFNMYMYLIFGDVYVISERRKEMFYLMTHYFEKGKLCLNNFKNPKYFCQVLKTIAPWVDDLPRSNI